MTTEMGVCTEIVGADSDNRDWGVYRDCGG